jgi:hypothetical protein
MLTVQIICYNSVLQTVVRVRLLVRGLLPGGTQRILGVFFQ